MHFFDAKTQTFEFHTILAYTDGQSLFGQWKEKEMELIKQSIGLKIA